MSKKYDELKDVLAGLTEKRKRINIEFKKLSDELLQISEDEIAVKRTIDVISNLGLDFGGGGRADDVAQRQPMVRGLRDSVLKILFEKGINHMLNMTEIMGLLHVYEDVDRTSSSVSGTLTLLTRDGLVTRRRQSTKRSKRKTFYYKLNDSPEAILTLRDKYGLDIECDMVELEAIMNQDVTELI